MSTPLGGVFVGRDPLLAACAEIWRAGGHRVRAVLTETPTLVEWAAARDIPCTPPGAALPPDLVTRPFDVLFSVTNFTHKPRDLGIAPRWLAINYHDGPLPRYGGFNVTAWALLAREPRHGVTWHTWENRIDEGEILAQRTFEVAPGETSLTLNARCYEAALDSFRELVQALGAGRGTGRRQEPHRATFFPRHARPRAACTIDWLRPAEEIEALVRALDFGPYANPLGLPKMLAGEDVLVVRRLVRTTAASDAPPGTVSAVAQGHVRVATASGDVEIQALATLEGEPLAPADALAARGVTPGSVLPSPTESHAARLGDVDAASVTDESFWADRLARCEWAEAPDLGNAGESGGAESAGVPPVVHRPAPTTEQMVASGLVLLARLVDRWELDVGLGHGELRNRVQALERWFASHVPLHVELDAASPMREAESRVAAALETARVHGTYARDLAARRPDLRPCARPAVIVELDDPGPAYRLPADARLALLVSANGAGCRWVARSPGQVERLAALHGRLLALVAAEPETCPGRVPLTSAEERATVLDAWNATRVEPAWPALVHAQLAAQAARTPKALALVAGTERLTYGELWARAQALGRGLRARGVGPEVRVGVALERGAELVVALLGVLAAGGAYVPLDPAYPAARLAFQVQDAGVALVLADAAGRRALGTVAPPVLEPAAVAAEGAAAALADADRAAEWGARGEDSGAQLAYLLYTSGSTGTPKGVAVEHRQVTNLFAALDARLGGDGAPGVWLAVTSVAFDISVLELLWTLARGFTVVVLAGDALSRAAPRDRGMAISLFYFASDEGEHAAGKYRLLLEGARFADANGLDAVWTPERHLHAFGGLYPNPSVAGAAVAAVTSRVAIRAGSVVLPLHTPIRVAEEWAVVDNLSGGRVGIAFASGWQPNDFVIRPESFAENKKIMARDIDVVRRLWRGEAVRFPNGTGDPVEVRTFPRPVQRELPFWITTAGNPESFRAAGAMGANLLTNLLGQSVDELGQKLALYRAAWREAGHPGDGGQVTLMLHTFLGASDDEVRAHVRAPLTAYLQTSLGLIKQYAWSYPAFRNRVTGAADRAPELADLSPEELAGVIDHAFERYYETSGLFGTPERCTALVERLREIGVREIACLVDFGVASDVVLDHLPHLAALRARTGGGTEADDSIPAVIRAEGVTHLQCTPSLAGLLMDSMEGRAALGSLRTLLVGGEALGAPLAAALCACVGAGSGAVYNMYGPTETTVWSTAHRLRAGEVPVPIGRPLANTTCYVLDARGEPVPPGVAGELYLGGAGVARGYHGRPDLTDSRFVSRELGRTGVTPGRLYRTGDRVRWREDGVLEFLGRVDQQLKLRGHRVEPGEVEHVLAGHPAVREAAVVVERGADGSGGTLVAYVVPRAAGAAAAERDENGDAGWLERLEAWRATYDAAYARGGDGAVVTAGWASSYTGAPIPEWEMREWADASAQRVLRHHPRRVLEIGCGTGMLLQRIAPDCERYDAVDFSEVALRALEARVRAAGLSGRVTLRCRAAHELQDLSPRAYDAVLLNSVVQYFPDAAYLVDVLAGAARCLAPGGVMVVGDVRSLPLLEAFHVSVALQRAPASLAELRERVRHAVRDERELVLDPRFFAALHCAVPGLRLVRAEPRRDRADNEMTRFRYDVTLRMAEDGERAGERADGGGAAWRCDERGLAAVRERLAAERPERVRITNVANARVAGFAAMARALSSGEGVDSLDDLRRMGRRARERAVAPESLWALGREEGYHADVLVAGDGETLDVELRRSDTGAGGAAWTAWDVPPEAAGRLANQPVRAAPHEALAGVLRERARARLPHVMVPSRIVVLDALPRTPNGKLDRGALRVRAPVAPAGDAARAPHARRAGAPPSMDPVERALCEIWREVLGVEHLGPDDDFFALGGHSLLAVRLHRRISDALHREISIAEIFRRPVLRDLARALREAPQRPPTVQPQSAITPVSRDRYRIT